MTFLICMALSVPLTCPAPLLTALTIIVGHPDTNLINPDQCAARDPWQINRPDAHVNPGFWSISGARSGLNPTFGTSISGGDDLVGVGAPDEWVCLGGIVLGDEAVDGVLQGKRDLGPTYF